MKRTVVLFIVLCAGLSSTPSFGQTALVDNIRPQVDGDRVLVLYDLNGTADAYSVAISVSLDDGRTFLQIQFVTLDVGDGVLPGRAKTIIWDPLADFPRGISSETVLFEVTATAMPGKKGHGRRNAMIGGLAVGVIAGAACLLKLCIKDPPVTFPTPPDRPPGN